MNKVINEHVFEIRYKPNPKILDYRGTWAEMVSEHMQLPEWRILENRIDIYDKINMNHAFVGFFNSGFLCNDSPTKNYFYDQAIKLFSFISRLDGFEIDPIVERIGVRSKFCTTFEKSFDELKTRFVSKYISLSNEAEKVMNAKLIDIGVPLNFADKFGNFNTLAGPMEKSQITKVFYGRKEIEIPEVGLYFDIDYFLKPSKRMKPAEVIKLIKDFAENSWDKHEKIKNLILGVE